MNMEGACVVVAQKGPRRHYSVPRALHQHGALACLLTDFYAPAFSPGLERLVTRVGGRITRRAIGRRAQDLPREIVRSNNLRSVAWGLAGRVQNWRCVPHLSHLLEDSRFARWLANQHLPPHNTFYGFSYASLEALRVEKKRGVFTILDQFDPAQVEDRLVREEMSKWPDYVAARTATPAAYYERVREEWSLADLIFVNSEWTRNALLEQGVPESKIQLGTVSYEIPAYEIVPARATLPPLRVLWLGLVNIRKGIPYLVEAARRLVGKPVEFTVAGPIGIRRGVVRNGPPNIRWLGQVPRREAHRLFQSHHVFVLPAISDNLPMAQLEALAHGMPVIITSNCGSVVRDGQTGFVIRPCSAEALADAIGRFLQSPSLLEEMSVRCVQAAGAYTIDRYGSQLVELINSRI